MTDVSQGYAELEAQDRLQQIIKETAKAYAHCEAELTATEARAQRYETALLEIDFKAEEWLGIEKRGGSHINMGLVEELQRIARAALAQEKQT